MHDVDVNAEIARLKENARVQTWHTRMLAVALLLTYAAGAWSGYVARGDKNAHELETCKASNTVLMRHAAGHEERAP